MPLVTLHQRLHSLSSIELSAKCLQLPPTYANRSGAGTVIVQSSNGAQVTLFEKGSWASTAAFTNAYRWTFHFEKGTIDLEHLRFGALRPVFLFTLHPLGDGVYKSFAPHICGDDLYRGALHLHDHVLHLDWKVTGPKKNEAIRLVYR